jgi:hypothetical protein
VVIILEEAASIGGFFHLDRAPRVKALVSRKSRRVSLDGSPLRCVCVEVCCVERRRT